MYNLAWGVYYEDEAHGPYCNRFLQESYEGGVYTLEAGKTYDIKLWYSEGGSVTRTFSLTTPVSAGSMTFMQTDLSVFTGNILTLRLVLSDPFALADSFSWSSSNPSVTSVTSDSLSSAEIKFLAPGTVTVTATNEVLSCSYTFSVQAPTDLIPGQTYYIANPTEGGYDLTFTPTASGKYMIYTNQQIPIGITPADINTEHHFFNGCQGIANVLRAGKQYTYTVYVPAWLNVAQLQVKIELKEAVSGFPSDDTPKATATPTSVPEPPQPTLPPENPLDLDHVYHISFEASEYKYVGTYLIEETGTYYLNVKAPHPEPWELFCEDELISPENVTFEDSDTEAEYVYTLVQGKKYKIICSTDKTTEAQLVLSRVSLLDSNQEPVQEQPPLAGPVVTDEAGFMERVEQENEGSTIHVRPEQKDNAVTLNLAAFDLASKRDMTVVIELTAGQVIFDTQTQSTIAQFSKASDVTVEMKSLAENQLNESQRQLLNSHEVAHIISASVFQGEDSIHDFAGGTATLRIPFTAQKDASYEVLYLPENGSTTAEETESFACTVGDDYIEFKTGHFSEFAVVQIPPEIAEPEPPATVPADTEAPNTALILGSIGAILLIGVLLFLRIVKKRKKQ